MWIKTQTQNINNTNDTQKKYRFGTVSKIFYWKAKTGFTSRQPHPSPDVDQDTQTPGLHVTPLTHHRTIPNNTQIKPKKETSKYKGPTVIKTEPLEQNRYNRQTPVGPTTAKASGPHHPINRQVPSPEPPQSLKPDQPACNQRGKQSCHPRPNGPPSMQSVAAHQCYSQSPYNGNLFQ